MNEGHSAFLVLELARELVGRGTTFADAVQQVRAHSVFTTHTPVPAGNDAFPLPLIEKYFWQYWTQLGLSRDEFLDVALQQQSWGPTFAMTVLALKLAERHNGVSSLHGQVAREMWQWLYPNTPPEAVPITSITNGVHTATWLAPEMRQLFEALYGARVGGAPGRGGAGGRRCARSPTRCSGRRAACSSAGWSPSLASAHASASSALAARRSSGRCSTKRPSRSALLAASRPISAPRCCSRTSSGSRPSSTAATGQSRSSSPVKAHPADHPGKLFIQQVYQLSQQPGFAGKILFLEEYDTCVAR